MRNNTLARSAHESAAAAAQKVATPLLHGRAEADEEEVAVETLTGAEEEVIVANVARMIYGKGNRAKTIAKVLRDPAVPNFDLRFLWDLSLLFVFSFGGALLFQQMDAPHMAGYMLGGMLIGPSALDLVESVEQVFTMAQFASIVLVFMQGLQYPLFHQDFPVTRRTLGLGTAIVLGTFVLLVVFGLASHLASSYTEAIMYGLATCISSTQILREAERHFRIFDSELLAVLVVQDGAMALTLSLPLALVGGPVTFLWTVTSMALLLMVALVFRFRFRDRLLKSLWGATGKQPGLFLLGLLSMCLIFGFMSRGVGLNMLYGAFIFGSAISGTHYVRHIEGAVESINAVFSCLYFASIGMVIKLSWVNAHFSSILLVLLEVLTSKFLVMLVLLLLAGFKFRKIILATVSIAPISEFSIIYMSRAYAQGVVSRSLYLNVLAATAVSMMVGPVLQRIVMSQSRPLGLGQSSGGGGGAAARGSSQGSSSQSRERGDDASSGDAGGAATRGVREMHSMMDAIGEEQEFLPGTGSKPPPVPQWRIDFTGTDDTFSPRPSGGNYSSSEAASARRGVSGDGGGRGEGELVNPDLTYGTTGNGVSDNETSPPDGDDSPELEERSDGGEGSRRRRAMRAISSRPR